YQGVGIYIGGAARACANPMLNGPGWVTAAIAQGWKLLPIYVGPQAPCRDFKLLMSGSAATASGEGSYAAEDAANRAAIAGLPAGPPIYADIESYHGDRACYDAVRAVLAGWTNRLHGRGYKAGPYSTYRSTTSISQLLPSLPARTALTRMNNNAQPAIRELMGHLC